MNLQKYNFFNYANEKCVLLPMLFLILLAQKKSYKGLTF